MTVLPIIIQLSFLARFFSRLWNPGASGIDFFAQDLSSENCLVVSPVSLVARVIHYLSLQKALATLVVPLSSFLGSPRFTGEVLALRFEFL